MSSSSDEKDNSFFEERQIPGIGRLKRNKDITKNSSNPEKTYESLNSEIRQATEEKLSDSSDNSNNNNTKNQIINCEEQLLSSTLWNPKNNNKDNNQGEDKQSYRKKFEAFKRQSMQTEAKNQMKNLYTQQNTFLPFTFKKLGEKKAKKSSSSDNNSNEEHSPIKVNGNDSENSGNNSSIEKEQNFPNECENYLDDSDENKYFKLNSFPKYKFQNTTEPNFRNPFNFEPLNLISQNNTPQQVRIINNPYTYLQQKIAQKNLFKSVPFSNLNNNYQSPTNSNSGSMSGRISVSGNGNNINLSTQTSSNNQIKLGSNYINSDPYEEDLKQNLNPQQFYTQQQMNNYLNLNQLTSESNYSNSSQNKNYPNSYRPINEPFENKIRRFYSFTFTQEDFYDAFTPNQSNRKTEFSGKLAKKEINLYDIASGKDRNTTLMIRNIPIKYTDEMLQKELKCFENKYDCLYMPYDYEKKGNKGYAFINFVNPLHILLFYEVFHGKSWNYFESKKICELNLAYFQGINEIKRHAKNYKGLKKPIFFVVTEEWKNCNIEVPMKYLETILERYPQMNYIEKKQTQTFLIRAF